MEHTWIDEFCIFLAGLGVGVYWGFSAWVFWIGVVAVVVYASVKIGRYNKKRKLQNILKTPPIAVLLLLTFLLQSCGWVVPRLPRDIPDVSTWTCFLPSITDAKSGEAEIPWRSKILKEDISIKGADFEIRPKDEVFSVTAPVEGVTHCWDAIYNWNRGHNTEDRKRIVLDRSKNYLIVNLDGVIKIVTYLKEHIWTPLKNFFGFGEPEYEPWES